VVTAKLLNEQHLKLVVNTGYGTPTMEALYWRMGDRPMPQTGDVIDCAGTVSLNTFNGQTRAQLTLADFRPTPQTAQRGSHASGAMLPQVPLTMATTPDVPATGTGRLATLSTSQPVHVSQASRPEPSKTGPISTEVVWVDHRHRQQLPQFVGLLMKEPLDHSIERRIFHEGREPQLPYVQPHHLVTRLTAAPADELIFWDFPPDIVTLQQVMQQVRPRVVHWIGGKYETVPVLARVQDYQKLLFALCNRLSPQEAYPLMQLASQLATSTAVIVAGLTLLAQQRVIAVATPGLHTVQIQVISTQPNGTDADSYLALHSWEQALQTVADWRHWCLKGHTSVWQSVLADMGKPTPVLMENPATRLAVPA
jgi:hypothetical protein